MRGKGAAVRITLAVAAIVGLLAAAIIGAYALGLHAIDTSQHHWCTTLALLTEKPVPQPADPAANPSREDAYLFYVHLKELERDFGCP